MTGGTFEHAGVTLDTFTRAYLSAALWVLAGEEPDGDRRERPICEDAFTLENCAQETLERARIECDAFQNQNAGALFRAGNPEQNGHDFFLTRNGHGAGFWDRGYPPEIGDRLTTAAELFGVRDFYLGDDGKVYFT